ncbi:Protein of unknown function [Sporolactobacillus nakayamae]|uniref:DUF1697 domain-containing protein n=1 Tax=Sporolactobacillus nakayamae TaxID=269670 RepID=A0A1I2PMD1_9BACL|nr:Protein of unknown function [Sporolactobacillus nakayamae]
MIYIALLRGINVGWKNKIKMADLREKLSSHCTTRNWKTIDKLLALSNQSE